jgi:hypothetical protein
MAVALDVHRRPKSIRPRVEDDLVHHQTDDLSLRS